MSNHIPFELQEEILKKLPVKPLLQFRCVSKAWKSLIDSSDFIVTHSNRHAHSHRLLIRYENRPGGNKYCISFADDDTFPQKKFEPTFPLPVERSCSRTKLMVGSSHGLLCWYVSQNDYSLQNESNVAVIWNPSIRKSVTVVVPDVFGGVYTTVLGFGVCPGTTDIKLVKITCSKFSMWSLHTFVYIPSWQVEIYTLSSGCWRSLRGNIPRRSITVKWSQVVIDRYLYWYSIDRIAKDGEFRHFSLIMSFDMATEEFREIRLPDSLAFQPFPDLSIYKLRDSLAVVESLVTWQKHVCSVWEMKHGVQTSFTKLFNIEAPFGSMKEVLGFSKSGKPLLLVDDCYNELTVHPMSKLVVYEPCSKSINDLGLYGLKHSFSVDSYMETLLLLNVPES